MNNFDPCAECLLYAICIHRKEECEEYKKAVFDISLNIFSWASHIIRHYCKTVTPRFRFAVEEEIKQRVKHREQFRNDDSVIFSHIYKGWRKNN